MSATHSDGILVQNGNTELGSKEALSSVQSLPSDFYVRFLSDVAKARRPSPIRGLLPLEERPGMISLLAGKPNAASFPFTSLSFTARDPRSGEESTLKIAPDQLSAGLQYGPTAGFPPFLQWLVGLQEREHGRKKSEGWRVTCGVGSQDLINKALIEMLNPGDSVLVDSPVYASVIPMFKAIGAECVEVDTDGEGLISSSLRTILESWPSDKPKPKMLYTVPYGCNPTGATTTLPRRKEVLQLAEEHDFLILEDDPYYYLYYGDEPRSPSYFALERELLPAVGRVLRFDSFSKVLSAGIRVGFATGPVKLLDAIDLHTAISNLQSPGLTNVLALTLVDSWGYDGFKLHTEYVSKFYREKRDVFVGAMKRHLAGLAEWSTPNAGMFVWFKLLIEGDDSEALVRGEALEKGVLALPGTVFLPDGRKTAYVRASFSLINADQAEEACRRLAETARAARK